MKIPFNLTFILICISCGENGSNNLNGQKGNSNYKVKVVNYSVTSIPSFFEAAVNEHLKELRIIDSSSYRDFCLSNNVDVNNSTNAKHFFTMSLIHRFFTCQNATNGSRGDIVNIPYYWHWVNPNPRYEIFLKKPNIKLKDVKPPKEFSKYKSYADIDRTPFLFLSELFLDSPKYYSSLSGTFSTFGWCSEREMAFVCLMDILGYQGKVIAENNHSWSEFIIPMIDNRKESMELMVKIDNTFDIINWNGKISSSITEWNQYQGKSQLAIWYNRQAHSENEKQMIKDFQISKLAIDRIEKLLVDYLGRTINVR